MAAAAEKVLGGQGAVYREELSLEQQSKFAHCYNQGRQVWIDLATAEIREKTEFTGKQILGGPLFLAQTTQDEHLKETHLKIDDLSSVLLTRIKRRRHEMKVLAHTRLNAKIQRQRSRSVGLHHQAYQQ